MKFFSSVKNKAGSELIDFIILGFIFFISCSYFSVIAQNDVLILSSLFALIVVIFSSLGKALHLKSKSFSNSFFKLLISNATGIASGALAVLLLGSFLLATPKDFVFSVVFSSIMAFFVLGTLYPLINKNNQTF
jgi:hypothetical protein